MNTQAEAMREFCWMRRGQDALATAGETPALQRSFAPPDSRGRLSPRGRCLASVSGCHL